MSTCSRDGSKPAARVLGGLSVDVPGISHNSAPAANVYVRPHELEIERQRNGTPRSRLRSHASIPPARTPRSRALRVDDGSEIQVDLPFERLLNSNLNRRQVYVAPRKVRVFVPEYSI